MPVCLPRADTTTGLSPEDILGEEDEVKSPPAPVLLLGVSCFEDGDEPRERHSPIEKTAVGSEKIFTSNLSTFDSAFVVSPQQISIGQTLNVCLLVAD